MSKPRSVYRPKAEAEVNRRKEWVALDDGEVCVWEMTVRESMTVMERSARPAIDKRGGLDRSEQILWQIIMSCYDGDQPGAKLLFDPADPGPVFRLRMKEFAKLAEAIGRVNGADEADLDCLRDFIEARQGA